MSRSASTAQRAPTRTIGIWMAAPLSALQALNAGRAFFDPSGFGAYMGAPLEPGGDPSWVMIYALRTAFIALLVAILLIRRDLDALKWTACTALVMPIGDAWIVLQAGAEPATLARHGAIAAYLFVTTIALFVAARAAKPAGAPAQ